MSQNHKTTVLLVDDSSVIRGALARIIESDKDIHIVGSVSNGRMGVSLAAAKKPDVVMLDVEMPIMDGLTALPEILKVSPQTHVIMCSSLTAEGADISMKALSLGAVECMAKPSSSTKTGPDSPFRARLLETIKSLGGGHAMAMGAASPAIKPLTPQAPPAWMQNVQNKKKQAESTASKEALAHKPKEKTAPPPPAESAQHTPLKPQKTRMKTAPPPQAVMQQPMAAKSAPASAKAETPYTLYDDFQSYKGKPDVLAIGSSTGGPQALFKVLGDIGKLSIPIVITQHMPATFTTILTKHITHNTGIPCHEGEDGMPLRAGTIYLAPGGKHMIFKRQGTDVVIVLDDGAAENFCKPAVDPMMRSLIKIYGKKILNVILTGMGSDGLHGARALVETGGRVIAQDEATSIVWGMPGAVSTDGLCSAVLPLDHIGHWVRTAGACS